MSGSALGERFRRLQQKMSAPTMTTSAAPPTPAPIPALAPVESPPLLPPLFEEELVLVEEETLVVEVTTRAETVLVLVTVTVLFALAWLVSVSVLVTVTVATSVTVTSLLTVTTATLGCTVTVVVSVTVARLARRAAGAGVAAATMARLSIWTVEVSHTVLVATWASLLVTVVVTKTVLVSVRVTCLVEPAMVVVLVDLASPVTVFVTKTVVSDPPLGEVVLEEAGVLVVDVVLDAPPPGEGDGEGLAF